MNPLTPTMQNTKKSKPKIYLGQRVRVTFWREAANHWDWPNQETVVGTVIGLPEPTYQNNWNYSPKEFKIRTVDGQTVQVTSPTKVEDLTNPDPGPEPLPGS